MIDCPSIVPLFLVACVVVAYYTVARALALGRIVASRRTKTAFTIAMMILAILAVIAFVGSCLDSTCYGCPDWD